MTGSLNVVQWYPWSFSFRATHEAVAFVAVGAVLTHIAVKLPLIRIALRSPVEDRLSRESDGPSRRAVLLGAGSASAWPCCSPSARRSRPASRLGLRGARR